MGTHGLTLSGSLSNFPLTSSSLSTQSCIVNLKTHFWQRSFYLEKLDQICYSLTIKQHMMSLFECWSIVSIIWLIKQVKKSLTESKKFKDTFWCYHSQEFSKNATILETSAKRKKWWALLRKLHKRLTFWWSKLIKMINWRSF